MTVVKKTNMSEHLAENMGAGCLFGILFGNIDS